MNLVNLPTPLYCNRSNSQPQEHLVSRVLKERQKETSQLGCQFSRDTQLDEEGQNNNRLWRGERGIINYLPHGLWLALGQGATVEVDSSF